MKALLAKIPFPIKQFVVFFIVSVAVFWPSISGDFFFDDIYLIVKNQYITSFSYFPQWFLESSLSGSSFVSNLFRPMQLFVYTLINLIFGLNATVFHLVNIALHALNGVIIFNLLPRFRLSSLAAMVGTFLFLVHPVQVESVAYIAGLPDVLAHTFIFGGLYIFSHAKVGGSKWYIGTVLMCLLAFLTKESSVVFAPLILITGLLLKDQYSKKEWHQVLRLVALLGGMTCVFIALKFSVLSFTGDLGLSKEANIYTESLYIRLLSFFGAIIHYIELSLAGVNLHFDKALDLKTTFLDWEVVLGFIIYVLGVIVAYGGFKLNDGASKLMSYGALFILVAMLPFMGIIPQNAIYAEHWLYLPMLGMIILYFGAYYYCSADTRFLIMFAVIVATFMWPYMSFQRSKAWADPVVFYENELVYSDSPHEVLNELGTIHYENGDFERAEASYLEAIALYDVSEKPYFNLCSLYYEEGKLQEASEHCERALILNSDMIDAYKFLYNIAVQNGDTQKAAGLLNTINQFQ